MKNTIMFAALATMLRAQGSNKNKALQQSEASPGGLAQLKAEAQIIPELGNWFENAGRDIGKWTVGAGEDFANFTIDQEQKFLEMMKEAGYDIEDFVTGDLANIDDLIDQKLKELEGIGDFKVPDLPTIEPIPFVTQPIDLRGSDFHNFLEKATEITLVKPFEWGAGAIGDTEKFVLELPDLIGGAAGDAGDWLHNRL